MKSTNSANWILVTGTSSGIGRATAFTLAEKRLPRPGRGAKARRCRIAPGRGRYAPSCGSRRADHSGCDGCRSDRGGSGNCQDQNRGRRQTPLNH